MVEINSMPLVSVILPVYLGEDYIKETIRCILSQTYTKIELLVIDDGSPDKSGSIADYLENGWIKSRIEFADTIII